MVCEELSRKNSDDELEQQMDLERCCDLLRELVHGHVVQNPSLIEQAAIHFKQQVERMAGAIGVIRGLKRDQREQLIDESVGLAYSALQQFDPSLGLARSYIYRTLWNRATDLNRSRWKDAKNLRLVPDRELAVSGEEPFEESQLVNKFLSFIVEFSSRDAVAVCLALGLEDIVPYPLWRHWWSEVGYAWDDVRSTLFTPTGRLDRKRLADLLGMSRAALDKVVSRARQRARAELGLRC